MHTHLSPAAADSRFASLLLASTLFLCSFVTSSLVAPAAVSQPVRMSPEQAQSYRAYRLDVEVVKTTTYRTVYDIDGARTYPSSVDVKWDGYIGTRHVSEADFYRHAGYDELADRISRERTRGKWFMSIGVPAFVGGTVVALIGTRDNDRDDEPDSPLLQNVGAGVGIIGIVLVGSGRRLLGKQHTSPREAQEAAIRFNTRLGREIVSGER